MSRSAGTYTLPSNSVSPAVADTVISPTDFNTVMDDIETAVNESTYTAGLGSTDNRLVRTDGTDTKKIQGSTVTVDDSGNVSGIGTLANGAQTTTSTSANALVVGANGATNPVLKINANTASVATGVEITGAAAAARVALSAISSGTDEGLSLDAKGSGTIRLGATSTGAIEFSRAAVPTSNDGAALGTTALMWSDLFLASGGVINFNNGDVTVTHSADALTFQGGANGYLFSHAVLPQTSDGAALGSIANMWSDLFLASGAVVNFNNGNVTLTHAAGSLTVDGATTVSLGTSAALTTGTIELGHATDTTIARSSAGDITIEGNAVYRAGGTDVALADGGTGASLVDPNADRIMFWDDSAGQTTWLEVGSGLSITGTTLTASGGTGDVVGPASSTDNAIVRFDGTTGKLVQNSSITIGDDGSFTAATGTITASTPWAFSQTWNNAGVTFAGMTIAMTDTASNAASEPFNISVGGTRRFSVRKDGRTFIGASGGYLEDGSGGTINVSNVYNFGNTYFSGLGRGFSMGVSLGTLDVFLVRSAAATLQMGAADAASPVAQTLRAQGSRAGTDTNIGGGNLTIQPGTGTGTGTAASLILRSPVTVASGTGAQTQTTGLTITSGIPYVPSYTVAGAPSAATAAGIIYVSNETGGAVLAFSDGTNWRRVTDRAIIA